MRKREETMANMQVGLEMFHIDQPPYREIEEVKKELTLLDRMWSLVRAWDEQWSIWKDQKFVDLDVDRLEEQTDKVCMDCPSLRSVASPLVCALALVALFVYFRGSIGTVLLQWRR